MFLILAIVLLVVWAGSFFVFKVTAVMIHLLLLFALISVVMHFVTGRKTA
jgi:hypothetical protein